MALAVRFVNPTGSGSQSGLTEADAYSVDDMVTNWGSFHFKYKGDGVIASTSTTTLAANTTASSPGIIEGYITTPGDATTFGDVIGNAARLFGGGGYLDSATWPSLQTGSDGAIQARLALSNYAILMGLNLQSGDTTNGSAIALENGCAISTCAFTDRSGNLTYAIENNSDYSAVENVDLIGSSTPNGTAMLSSRGTAIGCYFKNWETGINATGLGESAVNCVFDTCEEGIYSQSHWMTIASNSFYNSVEAIRGSSFNSRSRAVVKNIMWCDNSVNSYWYRDHSTPGSRWLNNNAVGNFQNEDDNKGDWIELNRITLTSNPFRDAPNGDFRLNTVADGGALCNGYGAVHTFESSSPSSNNNPFINTIFRKQ